MRYLHNLMSSNNLFNELINRNECTQHISSKYGGTSNPDFLKTSNNGPKIQNFVGLAINCHTLL